MVIPAPMSSHPPLGGCPFIAGPMITNPSLFIGRKDALQTLTTHITGVQPTSINVIGERRIGKSSLLYHFFQTWEQRVPQSNRYVVIYLSLQNVSSMSKEGFYQAIAKLLLQSPLVQTNKQLASGLRARQIDGSSFADILKRWKQAQILPVLCLDEFEVWLKDHNEFDDRFFDHLRSLMNNNMLMLIITSLRPLDEYGSQHGLTSAFFNVGHVLHLEGFADGELNDLLRLPASSTSQAQATLSLEEQRIARRWGGSHPYLLQLAAYNLYHARQQGKGVDWAKKQFLIEKQRLPRRSALKRRWWRPLRWFFWTLPLHLGRWSQWIGTSLDEMKVWLAGVVVLIVIIVVVIFGLTRIMALSQVQDLVGKLLKLVGVP